MELYNLGFKKKKEEKLTLPLNLPPWLQVALLCEFFSFRIAEHVRNDHRRVSYRFLVLF